MPEEQEAVEQEQEQVEDINPLDEAFPDEKPVDDYQEPEPEPDPDPEGEETGKKEEDAEMPSDEPEPEPEKEKEPEKEDDGIMAAYMAEKKKRQAYEQQLQQIQNSQQQPEPEFDWSNPEKTLELKAQQIENKFNERFLNMSEASCKQRHEDYDQKYEVFVSMATENPAIINQMQAQPDPAEWAYQQATKQSLLNEIGSDPEAYRQKIEAEVRAKFEAEQGAQKQTEVEKKIQQVSDLPPSAAKIKAKQTDRNDPIMSDPLGAALGDR
jgi:hypothetical protein